MKPSSRLGIALALAALAIVASVAITALQRPAARGTGRSQAAAAEIVPQRTTSAMQSPQVDGAERMTRSRARSATDWSVRLRKTEDYFEFVAAALRAAAGGDGRAAYYIGVAVALCDPEIRLARRSPDVERAFREAAEALEAEETAQAAAPAYLLAKQRSLRFQRCIRFAKDDPFAGLPPRDTGYYSILYWQDVAIELGDPVARAERAISLLARASEGTVTTEKRASFVTAQGYLRDAIRSGDADALFQLGLSLIDRNYSAEPVRGAAIILAACDLGFDCTGNTPLSHHVRCDFPEECPPPEDFRDSIQTTGDAAGYAWAYSLAQELLESYRRGDEAALDAFVRIDGRVADRYESRPKP